MDQVTATLAAFEVNRHQLDAKYAEVATLADKAFETIGKHLGISPKLAQARYHRAVERVTQS